MAGEEDNVPELPLEAPQEQPQETAQAAEAVAEEQPAQAAATEAPAAPEATEAEAQDWRDKELRRKHAQIKEKDRELERIRKENEDYRALAQRAQQQPAADGAAPIQDLQRAPAPQSLTETQVEERARQLREQERYQENLVSINTTGEKNYGKDWAKSLDNLATLGTVEPDTMQAIIGTDDPAKVLYELGKNPAEYQRIMELPKHRQPTEFVKLSLKQEAPKPKPSNAPAPTEPVQSRVTPSADLSDKDDDDTWYKKRQAQRAARRKERVGA